MKANKLTPGSNLLWESSRMMLPEHVKAIRLHNKEKHKKVKPMLDEQRKEEIERNIRLVMRNHDEVDVTTFGEYRNEVYRGWITSVDSQLKKVKVEDDNGDMTWVHFDDILSIDQV